MKNSIVLIIISLFLLITGCKKNYILNEKQHILFQYDYVNYSVRYNHEGFYVDDEGEIMYYSNPESWNSLSNDYNITEVKLADNLSKCIVSDVKTDKKDLIKFSSYIDNLASSKITARKNVGSDAGMGIFICYNYDEQNGIYKGTLIKMEGDVTCENLNFYSKKVTLWLTDLNNRISVK
ncbi:MAG TPA: hypothetical protein VMV47_06415 [Bacteroidales bacterium]|nr:hypothetical protein [Bacteroidales bacterium]